MPLQPLTMRIQSAAQQHPRHRDRRGTSTASGSSRTRTRRGHAFPHPPSTPPHDGHASTPSSSCRSTTARSPFTVSTTPPRVNPAALPPPRPNEETGGPHLCRRDHRAVAHEKGQPLKAALTPSAPSATQTRPYIVILSDRAQLVEAAWAYRHRPAIGAQLRRRQASASPATLARSWAAQQRLHATYAKLTRRGKIPSVAVTATARELAGFVWAEMTS